MNIKTVSIQNFKGFEQLDLSFNPRMTVLIGDNGGGKTSVLDAMSFVLGTFFLGIDGAANRPLRDFEKRKLILSPQNVEVQLPFRIAVEHTLEGKEYNWFRASYSAKGGVNYKHASDLVNRAKELTNAVRSGEEEVSLPLLAYYGIERLSVGKRMKGHYARTGSRLDGYYKALNPQSFKHKFLNWFKSYEDEVLKFNKDKALYHAFTTAITSMVKDWTNIHYSWGEKDMMGQMADGTWMPFGLLSDGYRNIIRLAADIAYRAIQLNPHLKEKAIAETEGVVLIDEVDMHLHPKWQRTVIADLKRTFPKIQFIITTHSPFIVQSLEADEVINLAVDHLLDQNPSDLSLEANISYMGVEDKRSDKFVKKREAAKDYLEMLEAKEVDHDVLAKLDWLLEEFSDDPVFVAKLKMKRLTKLGK
jgi:predicted ATP-binding protein involved in virulence